MRTDRRLPDYGRAGAPGLGRAVREGLLRLDQKPARV